MNNDHNFYRIRAHYDTLIMTLLDIAVEKYGYLRNELDPINVYTWDSTLDNNLGGEVKTIMDPVDLIENANQLKLQSIQNALSLLEDAHLKAQESQL